MPTHATVTASLVAVEYDFFSEFPLVLFVRSMMRYGIPGERPAGRKNSTSFGWFRKILSSSTLIHLDSSLPEPYSSSVGAK